MTPTTIHESYDAIIVGAGAAGLSATLELLRTWEDRGLSGRPSVLVVSKLEALRSHTGSAEGGIAASLGNKRPDSWEWHWYDTVKGGDWLVDQDKAEILAKDAPQTVIALEHDGVAFSRMENGKIAQRKFGGHTADFGNEPIERTAYAADRIGHQILYSLWQQCVKEGVEFAEEWYVTDLVLSPIARPLQRKGEAGEEDADRTNLVGEVDKAGKAVKDGETVRAENTGETGGKKVEGIIVFDFKAGCLRKLAAKNVLLATGGAGHLFHTTSNSWDLTGDGMALVLRAGLQLEDMEFIQFHPTGLAHTGILLSEAARGEGGVLRNSSGEAFMEGYAPEHKDLAARDVVTRAIMSEIDAGRGVRDPQDPDGPADCVWLDLRSIDRSDMEKSLPEVLQTIERYAGLNPSVDLVPVKPTAHYTMGGIPIDEWGQVYTWGRRQPGESTATSTEMNQPDGQPDDQPSNQPNRQPEDQPEVQGETVGETTIARGLFAAGECSCLSVHGANRLGANSLLDACLFGHRAGQKLAESISGALASSIAIRSNEPSEAAESDGSDRSDRSVDRSQSESEMDRIDEDALSPLDQSYARRKRDIAFLLGREVGKSDGRMGDTGSPEAGTETNPYEFIVRLGRCLERYFAIRCDADSLEQAQEELDVELAPLAENLRAHDQSMVFNQELVAIMEAKNLLLVAQTLIRSALDRQESRGSFYRRDFPLRDDEHFLTHTFIDQDGAIRRKPVVVTRFAISRRDY